MDDKTPKTIKDIANSFLSDFEDIEEDSYDETTETLEADTESNLEVIGNNSDDLNIVENKSENDFNDIFSDF